MIKMKKLMASGLFCGALLMGSVGGAFAASDRTMPGTPGEPGCQGQSTAFLAQLIKNSGGELPEEFRPGFGNLSKITGLSNEQLRQLVVDFCNEQP